MKKRFYLACFRDNVGANIAWHATNGCGYVTDLDRAHEYTLDEAQRAWDQAREYDQPISADHVDALSVFKVDCQRLPADNVISGTGPYVAFKKGSWSGNDVYWLTGSGASSLGFLDAKKLSKTEASSLGCAYIAVPFELADKAKRRTFDYNKFERRSMVQGAGLVTPPHIKKYKRRKPNPKVRFNCPSCGKLHWQYNPYDFESCNDSDCSEHASNQSGTFHY